METNTITSSGASTGQSTSRTGLADNFDSFLLLLTTQLQNQDPTAPMDTDQFTQQLVQFSGVEQQIKSNETLAELTSLLRGQQLSQSISYIGAEVEVDGDVVKLGEDGLARAHYDLEAPAAAVTVTISDEFGQVVASFSGETGAGRHSVTWDGQGNNGQQFEEGSFKIGILAETATGEPVEASTKISGVVDGVELHNGEAKLSVDGVLMPLSQVGAIRLPPVSL